MSDESGDTRMLALLEALAPAVDLPAARELFERERVRPRGRPSKVLLPAAAVLVVLGLAGIWAVANSRQNPTTPVSTIAPVPATTPVPDPAVETTSEPDGGAVIEIEHVVLVDGEPNGPMWSTGLARSRTELDALARQIGLDPQSGIGDVDFDSNVVIYFGPAASGGSKACELGPLAGVSYDPATGRLFPELTTLGSSEAGEVRACPAGANPHAILVAIARHDLPTTDFAIWLDNFDPPAQFVNRVTNVAAGELDQAAPSATPGDPPGASMPAAPAATIPWSDSIPPFASPLPVKPLAVTIVDEDGKPCVQVRRPNGNVQGVCVDEPELLAAITTQPDADGTVYLLGLTASETASYAIASAGDSAVRVDLRAIEDWVVRAFAAPLPFAPEVVRLVGPTGDVIAEQHL